jgi:asparagine synthetase B (glutamine-hydrolysing)
MCGIAGVFSRLSDLLSAQAHPAVLAHPRHRGPDDKDTALFERLVLRRRRRAASGRTR